MHHQLAKLLFTAILVVVPAAAGAAIGESTTRDTVKKLPGKRAKQSVQSEVEERPTFKKWSPWATAWFNWATMNMDYAHEGEAQISSYNHLSLDYRLGFGKKISIRPTFFVSGAGKDDFGSRKDSEVRLGDIYLQYYRYSWGLLPGNIAVSGGFRLYLPNSDYSKDQGMVTQGRAKFYFAKPMTYGSQVVYVFEPKYFVYSNRSHISRWSQDKDSYEIESIRTNKWGELRHYVEFEERIGETWGLSQAAGFRHRWYYDSENSGISSSIREDVELKLSAFINLGAASFKFGVNNAFRTRFTTRKQSYERETALYRPEQTEYSLMTSVRF